MERFRATFGSWYEKFIPIISSSEFQKLGATVNTLRKVTKVYPKQSDVFRCFRETPIDKFSILIWNDSPYEGPHNDGLAFSTNQTVTPFILDRFQRAIEQDCYEGLNLNFSTDLTELANQGVLLFNTALTVPNYKDWEWFNYEFVDLLNNLDLPIHTISIGESSHKFTDLLQSSIHKVESISISKWNHDNCFKEANKFINKNYGITQKIIW